MVANIQLNPVQATTCENKIKYTSLQKLFAFNHS